MGIIRKFIEDFKRGWYTSAAELCDRIATIDGKRYAVFYRRTFFRGRIKKNRPRLTRLPAKFMGSSSGGNSGNMSYEEAVEALRGDRVGRRNPLDDLKF
jgi:hypothetical protein